MSTFNDLETKLNDVFVGKAPALPPNGKKALVQYSPIISLVIGVLTLLGAISLWHWAHVVNTLAAYTDAICSTYAGSNCGGATSRLTFWVWVTLLVILVEGVLYLLAYPGLRDRKKQGWNYLYYGALLNVLYAIVNLFTSYNVVGNFIGALIGSAVGFYFLFQIRSFYTGHAAAKVAHEAKAEPKADVSHDKDNI